jgi:NADH-quinone oxidoreductase subunit J
MDPLLFLFFIFGGTAVTAAVAMILSEDPVHAVLFLVVAILALAGLFLTLDAEFLAALQVIVYAGAIMVLFLFVIMMLNITPGNRLSGILGGPAGFLAGGLLAVELVCGIALGMGGLRPGVAPPPAPSGTVENVGGLLMTRYVLPMELASILLLVGMVGAIALSKPQRPAATRGLDAHTGAEPGVPTPGPGTILQPAEKEA